MSRIVLVSIKLRLSSLHSGRKEKRLCFYSLLVIGMLLEISTAEGLHHIHVGISAQFFLSLFQGGKTGL